MLLQMVASDKQIATESSIGSSERPPEPLARVRAVVLTHRRPALASDLVRTLLDVEGFDRPQVLVVVNGEGGLDNSALERRVTMIRLPENLGPAGGFREALKLAVADEGVDWIYLCEDDVTLFDIPHPRVASVLDRAGRYPAPSQIGAIVAYGRQLSLRSGVTRPQAVRQEDADRSGFMPVDCAAWGATLIRADLVREGFLPDETMFFGYEDFDYFFSLRSAGYQVLLDCLEGRQDEPDSLIGLTRDPPECATSSDSWRGYYGSRNFFVLARRHGRWTWFPMHVVHTVRRIQLAPSREHRHALMMGFVDGLLGRSGPDQRFQRPVGE